MSSTTPPHIDQPIEPATAATGTEQHGAKAHSDGGWDAPGTTVPVQTRSERPQSGDIDAFPTVTGREVNWKFAPLAKLQPLLDGGLDGSAYPYLARQSEGADVEWGRSDDPRVGTAGLPEDRAAAAAWTARDAVLAVTIKATGAHEFITITRSGFGTQPRAAHTVITAEAHAQGIVVLDNRGTAFLSENVEIVVRDGARLTVVSLQDWDDDAVHVSTHFAEVGRDAFLKHVVVSLGGDVVRVNPSTHLGAQGADTEMYGVYFADAGQYIEQQVYVNHDAPNTRGRVNYKGALQGEGAHTVWIGDVLIGRSGDGTDSYEQNRNLVLTDGTRADSVPNLEIKTGDIEGAGHASATGRFDDEQLFYLQARGIPEDAARRLVVRGFLASIVQKIGVPELEQRLQDAIEAELEEARS